MSPQPTKKAPAKKAGAAKATARPRTNAETVKKELAELRRHMEANNTAHQEGGAALARRLADLETKVNTIGPFVSEETIANWVQKAVDLGNEVAALMARINEVDDKATAAHARIDATIVRVDALASELKQFADNKSIPVEQRHRKHVALGAVIRNMKLSIAELQQKDASAPGYADAVNAELERLNGRIDAGHKDLEGRVTELEGTVGLLGPTVAGHTDAIEALQKDIVRIDGLVSTSTTVSQGEPNWVLGLVLGAILAFAAWWAFDRWTGANTTELRLAFVLSFFAGLAFGLSKNARTSVTTTTNSVRAKASNVLAPKTKADPATPADAPAPADATAGT